MALPLAVPLALAGAQAVMGGIQAISGSRNAKKLMAQRTPYKTPEEIFKQMQLAQSMAGQGYDAFTLNYLTGNIDRAFSETTGTAKRLGADANSLSGLLAQRMQSIMQVGAGNAQAHQGNLKNFSAMLGVVAANKTAEGKSEQDIIKDKLQQAGLDKQQGMANITSAANALISIMSADATGNLYKEDQTALANSRQDSIFNAMPQMGRVNSINPPEPRLSGMNYQYNSDQINPYDLPYSLR